jgi:hypothetical protein
MIVSTPCKESVRHRFAPGLHRAHTPVGPSTGLRGRRRGRPVCLPQVRRNILTYTCAEAILTGPS